MTGITASNYVNEQMEIDDCLNFNKDISSTVIPRWKRKALSHSLSSCNSPKKTPGKIKGKKTPTRMNLSRKTPTQQCRFIPNRGAMDLANAHFNLMKENAASEEEIQGANGTTKVNECPTKLQFKNALADNMGASNHRVLAFKQKAPQPTDHYNDNIKVLYTQNKAKDTKKVRARRLIQNAPERILDAPDLIDDYYLNLLHWGSNNMLAVALGRTVYLWNAETGGIDALFTTSHEDDYISSIQWVQEGNYLAVGTNACEVQLWDAEAGKLLRKMNSHSARVSALSWNEHIISSGSRDSAIVHHDVRVASHEVARLEGHVQEVCGLKWSPDGQMLASGGNDNLLCLWDVRGGVSAIPNMNRIQQPKFKLAEHISAVKALAWSPHQRGLLASGGGTADRTIKTWNAANGALLNSIDTGSQVCSLTWNPHEKELLSSHGFSENQLCLWSYPTMAKVKELTGHTARVLHLTNSPCGTVVCSAAADETLRFWKVFDQSKKHKRKALSSGKSVLTGMSIR